MALKQAPDRPTLEKLRKVWAMRGSAHPGERANAERLATRIVAGFGYWPGDIEDLLRGVDPSATGTGQQARGSAGFTCYDMGDPAQAEAWAEVDRRRWRAQEPERAAVLRRYGSLEAVLAWTEHERLLRAAVAPWTLFHDPPDQQRTKSIDGRENESFDKPSARVVRALSEAYPLPTSITAAAAEYGAWRRRDRELGLFSDFPRMTHLDLSAQLRENIVGDLLWTGLRATSVAEVLLRCQHAIDIGFSMPEVDQAVVEDLECLVAREQQRHVQNGHPTASSERPHRTARQRSAEVRRLLSNVDTSRLSDREIARRAGVSPQTVGNIRRRL
jgi:hypothetical protein